MGRSREGEKSNSEDRLQKRQAILAALSKATEDDQSLAISDDEIIDGADDYYTLSQEEMEALISGNIEKIESWVSNLDRRHATWLLRHLIRESW